MAFRIDFFDETVVLDATPEAAGALLENVEGWPSWSSGVSRGVRFGADKTWRVGLMIGFVPRFLRLPLRAPVLEYEPNRRLSWGVRNAFATLVHGFTLEPVVGGRCGVRHTEYAEGALGIGARPLGRAIARFDREWTRDLVAHFAERKRTAPAA